MCVHRWFIATPDGPTCPAVCRRCGATREYPSAGPEYKSPSAAAHAKQRALVEQAKEQRRMMGDAADDEE